jgi:hypothetical protein
MILLLVPFQAPLIRAAGQSLGEGASSGWDYSLFATVGSAKKTYLGLAAFAALCIAALLWLA